MQIITLDIKPRVFLKCSLKGGLSNYIRICAGMWGYVVLHVVTSVSRQAILSILKLHCN
jgi:hypothetical protein